jgi:hypothetical protein
VKLYRLKELCRRFEENVMTPSSGKKNFCQTTRRHMQEDHAFNIVLNVTPTDTVRVPPPPPPGPPVTYDVFHILSLSPALTGKVIRLNVFVHQYGKPPF